MTTQDSTREATGTVDTGPKDADEQLVSGEHAGDRSGDLHTETRAESSGTADQQLASGAARDDQVSGAGRDDQASGAGQPAAGTGAGSAAGAEGGPGGAAADSRASALIAPDRARSYQERWNELKGQFVDDPRHAVRRANGLVGEVLGELEEVFRRQRGELERGLDDDRSSTEDLRLALGRYREFFDRLLSF